MLPITHTPARAMPAPNPLRSLQVFVLAVLATLALVATQAGAAPVPLRDVEITRAVERALDADPAVSAHLVDVATEDGIVDMTGEVNQLLAKRRAGDVAAAVKGVRGVINRIEVRPEERSDSSLRQDVKDALLWDPAVEAAEIAVAVEDGVVRLTGEVDSFAERSLAETATAGVIGVRDVENRISVLTAPDRPDEEIAAEIRRRLQRDAAVDAGLLTVSVEDGAVTLAGTAGSLAEKLRAQEDAWVAGVEKVDADPVEIEWWARDEMWRPLAAEALDDASLALAVTDALMLDPRVSSFDIVVEVDNGVATLSGTVTNLRAALAAEQDARNVRGIRMVDSYIRVRPIDRRSDEQVESRIETAYSQDPYLNAFDIDVQVLNGEAYLRGEVNSAFEQQRAEQKAAGVQGVVSVVNLLRHEREWAWRPDFEIEQRVEQELFWSPFVDSGRIHVEVEDGVVTLTGRVGSWREYGTATENAFEGGAKDVLNRLKVDYSPWFGNAG